MRLYCSTETVIWGTIFASALGVVIVEPRQRAHLFNALRHWLSSCRLLDKDGPAGAARTYIDRHGSAFINQHFPALRREDCLLKLLLLPLLWRHLLATCSAATAAAAKTTALSRWQRV